MAFEMMDTHHRAIEGSPQSAGHPRTDEQRAGEARTLGVSDDVDVAQFSPGFLHHLPRKGQHAADVVARGELRNHTTVCAMHVDLAVQGLAAQARNALDISLDQSHASFVARRFDAQKNHAGSLGDRPGPDAPRGTRWRGICVPIKP